MSGQGRQEVIHGGRGIRIEASEDGLHVCTFDEGHEPLSYYDQFITIPVEVVPWFEEAVCLLANRSPLFTARKPKKGAQP